MYKQLQRGTTYNKTYINNQINKQADNQNKQIETQIKQTEDASEQTENPNKQKETHRKPPVKTKDKEETKTKVTIIQICINSINK